MNIRNFINGYEIDDTRQNFDMPLAYVIATDTFLSGWGHAPGRSLFAVAAYSERDIDAIEIAMRGRTDMRRPRVVSRLTAQGRPNIRLHDGDHLSIHDRSTASEFYKGAAANWCQ